MFKNFLTDVAHFESQANYVEFGYGQVEPNHLSAQRTAQVYAQLPAAKEINILEQGQFVKYDYAANDNGIGEVNFAGKGEWMLVFNEIKLYRTHPDGSKQWDCEFAMKADDYHARVYTPYDWENVEREYRTHALNGKRLPKDPYDLKGESDITMGFRANKPESNPGEFDGYPMEKVTASPDPYELNYNEDPFHKLGVYNEKMMNTQNTNSMVPRVFKTNVGDIMTTNTINFTKNENLPKIGTLLNVDKRNGILTDEGTATSIEDGDTMRWQVVKIYTMPDGQRGVKVMRVA